MNPNPLNSDVTQAAVNAAALSVQADADRLGHLLTFEQCENLAIVVIGAYQSFTAGVNYAATLPRAGQLMESAEPEQNTAGPDGTTVEGPSSTEPGQ